MVEEFQMSDHRYFDRVVPKPSVLTKCTSITRDFLFRLSITSLITSVLLERLRGHPKKKSSDSLPQSAQYSWRQRQLFAYLATSTALCPNVTPRLQSTHCGRESVEVKLDRLETSPVVEQTRIIQDGNDEKPFVNCLP